MGCTRDDGTRSAALAAQVTTRVTQRGRWSLKWRNISLYYFVGYMNKYRLRIVLSGRGAREVPAQAAQCLWHVRRKVHSSAASGALVGEKVRTAF